ncbi:MAG: CDP-alcohol phosphatidyltransferase family protein [Propionibacteriaceae bacterium]|nr:CDP-alcohol phosphatidyltransferase family protein [Propionibacteriaceae bacterium]
MREGRAVRDAVATVVLSLVLGLVLTYSTGANLAPSLMAILAGLLIPVLAAVSVMRRTPMATTAADRITLFRGVLAGGCATLVALSLLGDLPSRSWTLFLLALAAFVLDGVDGWLARRTGTASAAGGRLDMESDAAFFLVLSVGLVPVVGGWVLGIGAMRYLFWLAARWRPALREPLAFSHFRRITAGLQGGVLVAALLPVLPPHVGVVAASASLMLLIISFGKDTLTLELAHAPGIHRSTEVGDRHVRTPPR